MSDVAEAIAPTTPETGEPAEWNFPLIATSQDAADRLSRYLGGSILSCGGWILSRASVADVCLEIDFEFPRANCVEMYTVLIAAGLTLSREGHSKLTELCQCTLYMLATKMLDPVRLQLTVFANAATGCPVAADEAVSLAA